MKKKIINTIVDFVVLLVIYNVAYFLISKSFLSGVISTGIAYAYLMIIKTVRELWDETKPKITHYHFDEAEVY